MTYDDVTDEVLERCAVALWREQHGGLSFADEPFFDLEEREAAWANTLSDVDAVLRVALGEGVVA